MQKITKYRYDIYLFVIEAICMVMELCASIDIYNLTQ